MIPATLSVRTFDQLTGFVNDFEGRRPQMRAFFSMVDRRKRLHCDLVQHLSTERAGILTNTIPALSIIEQMAEHRAPVTAFAPHSAASHCYRALWAEITGG
jgi:cellulose biosynthesis protein BcsQ